MLYPLIDFREWAKTYNISLQPRKCSNCELLLYPEIPFAVDDLRGLKSKEHDCGSKYDLKRLAFASNEKRNEMKDFAVDVKDILT